MLKKHFPGFHYLREESFRWCYTDKAYLPLIQNITHDFDKLLIEQSSSRHSHISFAYDHSFQCTSPVFIKFQHVRHMKQKIKETLGWKHKYYGYRFGIAEVLNLLKTREAGIPCPDMYAIGEVRKGMLVDSYIVLMEYLSGYKTLSDALDEANTDEDKLKLLGKTASIIMDLFHHGIFHSDFSSKNVMLSSVNDAYKVVDFEYIRFAPEPNAPMLAFLLGYLYKKWCADFMDDKLYDRWAFELIRGFSGVDNGKDVIDIYERSKSRHYSRKEIIAMVDSFK